MVSNSLSGKSLEGASAKGKRACKGNGSLLGVKP